MHNQGLSFASRSSWSHRSERCAGATRGKAASGERAPRPCHVGAGALQPHMELFAQNIPGPHPDTPNQTENPIQRAAQAAQTASRDFARGCLPDFSATEATAVTRAILILFHACNPDAPQTLTLLVMRTRRVWDCFRGRSLGSTQTSPPRLQSSPVSNVPWVQGPRPSLSLAASRARPLTHQLHTKWVSTQPSRCSLRRPTTGEASFRVPATPKSK